VASTEGKKSKKKKVRDEETDDEEEEEHEENHIGNWSFSETEHLISIMGEHEPRLKIARCNADKAKVWQDIVDAYRGGEYRRTLEQCRNKWNWLKDKLKEAINLPSGL